MAQIAFLSISSRSSPPRALTFQLPDEVQQLPSHVTWLEEVVPFIEKAALEHAPDGTLKSYVKALLEDEKLDQRHEEDDDEEPTETSLGLIALKLNRALMEAYVGNFQSALDMVKDTRAHIAVYEERSYIGVLEYFADALEWTVEVFEGLQNGNVEQVKLKGILLKETWRDLGSVNNSKLEVVQTFLKGCLAAALKVKETKVLEYFVLATKLDPKFPIWYHYAYRKTRRIRKERRVFGGKMPLPSGDERRFCEMAYKLRCENDVVCLLDHALLLRESLWTEPFDVWQKKEKEYLECLQAFEKVLKLSTETCRFKFAHKAKRNIAEILLFGKGRKLDQAKGKRLLLELDHDSPNDSTICHKVAKLYHKGAYAEFRQCRKFKNPKVAETYYERATSDKFSCSNYPCVMDYLRLLEEKKDYEKAIQLLDKSLKHEKRDVRVAKLLGLKGDVLWTLGDVIGSLDKSRMAIECWLQAVENYDDYSSEIYAIIRAKSCQPGVISLLEQMKIESVGKQRMIAEFIAVLQRQIQHQKHVNAVADVYRRYDSNRARTKSVVLDLDTQVLPKKGKGKQRSNSE